MRFVTSFVWNWINYLQTINAPLISFCILLSNLKIDSKRFRFILLLSFLKLIWWSMLCARKKYSWIQSICLIQCEWWKYIDQILFSTNFQNTLLRLKRIHDGILKNTMCKFWLFKMYVAEKRLYMILSRYRNVFLKRQITTLLEHDRKSLICW